MSQVNELKERVAFYERLVANYKAEIDQLKLEVTAVNCSRPQSQNASVQTLLVEMVPRCSQTDRVCTQSVASQIRVEVDEVSVQTDAAMETNKKEDFGNVNETLQSENKDPFSEESFDTPTGTPTLSPVSESENHVSSEEDVVMDCFAQSHKVSRVLIAVGYCMEDWSIGGMLSLLTTPLDHIPHPCHQHPQSHCLS